MKRAAEELGINYSTAKTIVQTFRREKRIAKKPKRGLETKRTLRRERHLAKVLVRPRVSKILARILAAETAAKLKTWQKEVLVPPEVSMSTLAGSQTEQAARKAVEGARFPRIISADQIDLMDFVAAKAGNSVAVQTEALAEKKDVFFVFPDSSLDDKFKARVDYVNPVHLRCRSKLPVINVQGTKESHVQGAVTIVPSSELGQETGPTFFFGEYGQMITEERYRDSRLSYLDMISRTLPFPSNVLHP